MLDICACLITLLQDHNELSALILELGFVGRMRENLESTHVSPQVYELSLLVLCAILRGPSILHRTVVLAVSPGGCGHSNVNSHSQCQNQNQSHIQRAGAVPSLSTGNSVASQLGLSMGLHAGGGSMSTHPSGSVVSAHGNAMMDFSTEGPMSVFSFDSAATEGVDTPLTAPMAYQSGNVLTHVIFHLGRTENALTKSDLCRALVCTQDFGGSCANDCFAFGLLGALTGVLREGSHDLTVDAGR